MIIPVDFAFSQHNLQDYLDCPRRFELRYLLQTAWPAIRSEPVLEMERHQRLGQQFHQMIQQHQLGLPEEVVASQAVELELDEWWRRYLTNPPPGLPSKRFTETTLAAPFKDYRLIAKYDLIAIDPGQKAVIVDWKTNQKKIPLAALKSRAQTRLYPFLLVLAGKTLNAGMSVQPDQVEMTYWFTADPAGIIKFEYTLGKFQEDENFFSGLIEEIHSQPSPFPLTQEYKQCLFCNYRSLCQRGTTAGMDPEAGSETDEDELLRNFDFDQIQEIEY